MSNRRRATAVLALVAGVALAVAGCGNGDDEGSDSKPDTKTSASTQGSSSSEGTSSPDAEPTEVLAQIKGGEDITVTINEAKRDSGGFVTVRGTLTNSGDSNFNASTWAGQEVAVQESGASVAGAVLVDLAGKKRYYVLRDTEGKCLCTMGLIGIDPGQSVPVFAQFPAPAEGVTEVEFQLPTMPPAKIQISEG